MPYRVELIDEAVGDFAGYAESGNLKLFLKKLVEIEQTGASAGQPLGNNLATWRKIVVGNRDWRIVFRISESDELTTILVVGDRNDSECYEAAIKRVASSGNDEVRSLAETMLDLMGNRKERKQAARKSRRNR